MLVTWLQSTCVVAPAVAATLMMLEYEVDESKAAAERRSFGASATLMTVCRVKCRERVHRVA